jgi:hypothetical protein
MLPDPPPGSPEDWLRHARSDLALARPRHDPAILLATLCFHRADVRCCRAATTHDARRGLANSNTSGRQASPRSVTSRKQS